MNIVGTIHLTSKFLFGHTSRNVPIYLFHPFDAHLPPMRVGCSSKDKVNKVCVVKQDTEAPAAPIPRGLLHHVFGNAGDETAERQALLLHYAPLRKQIETAAVPNSSSSLYEFSSTSQTFTFNIDPPGCRDIDDCLTIEPRADGTVFFAISIANLLETVLPGTPLDTLARQQGVTLYDNGQAVAPMLPRSISEGSASFLEGTTRPALRLSMIWDGTTLRDLQFDQGLLQNHKSFTYETIYQDKHAPMLAKIASHIKGSPSTDAHEWVEQCMVFYNQQVANLFMKHSTGLLRSLATMSPMILEQKAATYVLPSKEATHAAFGHIYYTHATSPIRRYADILAQRALAQILWGKETEPLTEPTLAHLNNQMKQSARFERDTFFLHQMVKQPSGSVECVILGWKLRTAPHATYKIYVQVPEWNGQILSVPVQGEPQEDTAFAYTSKDERQEFTLRKGDRLALHYYCDLQQPNWKRRMVCTLKKQE
jgi:exoribonuclease R